MVKKGTTTEWRVRQPPDDIREALREVVGEHRLNDTRDGVALTVEIELVAQLARIANALEYLWESKKRTLPEPL